VSKERASFAIRGYGLGVVVGDLNADGWPDIYVSNDGTPNDVVYSQQSGRHVHEQGGRYLKHASYAGMGVDIADFNDDGWPGHHAGGHDAACAQRAETYERLHDTHAPPAVAERRDPR
jgi:Ca2+-binding RTX toxin-like protein